MSIDATSGNYTVQQGDTLCAIAKKKYQLTDDNIIFAKAKELAAANNISNPNLIFPGQNIDFGETVHSATKSKAQAPKNIEVKNITKKAQNQEEPAIFSNIGKGISKSLTSPFTDEKGKFSLKQTALTVGVCAGVGALVAAGVVSAPLIAVVGAIGALVGGWQIGKGVLGISEAKNTKELNEACVKLGEGVGTIGMTFAGAKTVKNGMPKVASTAQKTGSHVHTGVTPEAKLPTVKTAQKSTLSKTDAHASAPKEPVQTVAQEPKPEPIQPKTETHTSAPKEPATVKIETQTPKSTPKASTVKAEHVKEINVADYPSKKVLNDISAMKGSAIENVDNIKNVFMGEMGYDPALINVQIKELPTSGILNSETIFGGFNYYTGDLILNQKSLSVSSKEQLAGLMRHELDHFDKSVKVCKSIGVDEYEKLFAGVDKKLLVDLDGTELKFNRAFWEKAIQNADTKDFDSAKYSDALKKSLAGGSNQEGGLYGEYLKKVSYVANPLEESAYGIQHSVEKGLNAPSLAQTYEYITPMFNKVDKALNVLVESNPTLKDSKGAIFDYLYTKAIIESDPKLASLCKQASSSATPDEALVKELQELMGKKMSSLQGSMFSAPDTEYEAQVFEAMVGLAKKGITQDEVIEAFGSKQQMLTQQLGNILNSSSKDLIKNKLGQNSEQYLAYLDANKVDDAGTVFDLLLSKIHSENNISKMYEPRIEDIKISDAVKNRIYSNDEFRNILKSNNIEGTPENNERALLSILKQTSPNIF